MATIAELNIRLGLLSKQFERSLASFEKKVQGAAIRMGDAGEKMSLAFTVPLVGIGVAAIKTAGEFEALRLGMNATLESVGRGAQEATAEISELQKVALGPGISFEQAVKGSVRLQGVGISAEKARLIIQELGNQIASSGGSAEQLDAVTKQFTQIIGKGRILQEDLTIILENMPSLARALKDEFGTTSAEALRDLGVSAEDFIDRLTNRMATLPRAAGGISNSIVNATVAIRSAFAKVGETIDKVFNVSGALDAFSAWVVDLADRFASLDVGTQKAIIGVGIFVASLGPALKIMSLITSASTSLVGTFARVAESFRITSIAGTGTIGVFSRLNTAMKAALFVGVTGAIIALTVAISAMALASDGASESQRIFSEAQRTVNEEVGKETAILNKNFDVLKSATATTEERTAAIKELQATYPQYLRNVDLEGASLTALTEIQGQLNSQILKGVAERQKAIAVEAQYNKVAQAQLRITQLRQQGFDALTGEEVKLSGRSLFGTDFEKDFVSASAKTKVVADVIKILEKDIEDATQTTKELSAQFDETFGIGEKAVKKSIDPLVAQRTALEAAKDAMEDMNPAQRNALEFSRKWDERWKAMKDSGRGAFSGATASTKLYEKALASINAVAQKGDVLGSDVMTEQAKEIENQIERLLENGFKPYSKEILRLQDMLKGLREDVGQGFAVPNFAQAAVGEIDKINRAISDALKGSTGNLVEIQAGIKLDPTTIEIAKVPDQVVSIEANVKGKDELDALSEAANRGIESAEGLKTHWQQIAEIMAGLSEGLTGFSEGMTAAMDLAIERGDIMGSVALSMGEAMSQAAAEGETSFGKLAAAAVAGAAKIVRAWIQQGVAAAVAKALSTIPFPFNLAAGAVAGAVAATLFTKAISAIGVPGLAEGGFSGNSVSAGAGRVGKYSVEAYNAMPQISAGFTGRGGQKDHTGHKVAGKLPSGAVVHDGEYVNPKWQVAKDPQIFSIIDQARRMGKPVSDFLQIKGFAAGGFTAPAVQAVSKAVSGATSSTVNNFSPVSNSIRSFAAGGFTSTALKSITKVIAQPFAVGGFTGSPTAINSNFTQDSITSYFTQNMDRSILSAGGSDKLVTTLKGSDIQIALERTQKKSLRSRGY